VNHYFGHDLYGNKHKNAGGQAVSGDISPTRSELTLYLSDLG
jgi:hypothetical protein